MSIYKYLGPLMWWEIFKLSWPGGQFGEYVEFLIVVFHCPQTTALSHAFLSYTFSSYWDASYVVVRHCRLGLDYRKNLNNWTVCYVVQNSLLWKGGQKHSKSAAPFPLPRQKKKRKFLDHTERGKSNDIAHRPIIQVFTVFGGYFVLARLLSTLQVWRRILGWNSWCVMGWRPETGSSHEGWGHWCSRIMPQCASIKFIIKIKGESKR